MPGVAAAKVVLASVVIALSASAAVARSSTALCERDIRKAEKIIAKLHRLEEVMAPGADFDSYKAEIKGLYPSLFVDASGLHEGDLKTDLTTAVFLYEAAYRARLGSGARGDDCADEIRGAYLKLCLETSAGDPSGLLRAKARLHARWGAAVVLYYRGARDPGTLRELSEMEAERKVDLALAERAVGLLRRLTGRLGVSSSGEASDEMTWVNSLPYEQLSAEGSEALSNVERILASLPRGRLRLLLHNAWSSCRDGLYWWGKTYLRERKTVPANELASPDPLKVIGLPTGIVRSNVLANWRNAFKYTLEAERAIGMLKA